MKLNFRRTCMCGPMHGWLFSVLSTGDFSKYFSEETVVSACYSDVAGWKTDTHAHCTHTDTHVHAYRHTDIQTQIDISFNPKTINSLKRQKNSPKDLFWFIIFFLKIHANPSQTKFPSSQPLDPVNYRPDRHPITITIIIIIVAR